MKKLTKRSNGRGLSVNDVRELYFHHIETERETILIRLGQIEDDLVSNGRLKRRTKRPRR